MSQQFSKGDTVRRTAPFTRITSHRLSRGAVRKVIAVESNGLRLQPLPGDTFTRDYTFSPGGFERAEPQWVDIAPGDKVTFKFNRTGEVFVTEAYDFQGEVSFLSWRAGCMDEPLKEDEKGLTLLSVEKPAPSCPTTPGSHVTVSWPGWESGANHLFLWDNGEWHSQTGARFGADPALHEGFTILHDAGAES
jgi:hypothetical protein